MQFCAHSATHKTVGLATMTTHLSRTVVLLCTLVAVSSRTLLQTIGAPWCSLQCGAQTARWCAIASFSAGEAPAPAAGRSRTMTVVNACSFPVWPLTYGEPMLGSGSFMLRSGENTTFMAPPGWLGTWGARTGCQYENASAGTCQTGQCSPTFKCYNGNVAPYTQARSQHKPPARRSGGAPSPVIKACCAARRLRCCSTRLAASTFTMSSRM